MDSAELEALKGKRSAAQALFSKRANKLSLAVDLLEEKALTYEIRTLSVDFGKLHDTGLEYVDALGEVKCEEGKVAEEVSSVEEKLERCFAKYTKTLQVAKETLWSKFAYVDLKLYADGAEEKCAELEDTDVSRLPEEEFQALHESLVERISMFEQQVLGWEGLVPGTKTTVYKQQLYKLRNRL